jgi:ABC-type sugar transport system permease subunit
MHEGQGQTRGRLREPCGPGSISPELIDAGRIDGCNLYREFIHVVIPALWPFLKVTLITGVVGIFLSGPPLFTFFSLGADKKLWSFDYYLFCNVMKDPTNKANQMYSSAASLMVSAIVAPIMYTVKWLLGKYGPSED